MLIDPIILRKKNNIKVIKFKSPEYLSMLFQLLLEVDEIFHVHPIILLQDDQLRPVIFEQYVQSIRHVLQPIII